MIWVTKLYTRFALQELILMPNCLANMRENLTTQCRYQFGPFQYCFNVQMLLTICECNILHLGLFFTRQIFELLSDFQEQYVLVEDQSRLSREIFPRKVRKRPKVIIKKMERRAIPLRYVLIVMPNFDPTRSD